MMKFGGTFSSSSSTCRMIAFNNGIIRAIIGTATGGCVRNLGHHAHAGSIRNGSGVTANHQLRVLDPPTAPAAASPHLRGLRRHLSTSSASKAQMKHKHWHKEWKPLRRLKVIKVELPNYREQREKDLTPDQMRSKLKEKGIAPARPWVERQIELSSTGGVFEPYVPPEGDGKASLITPTGAKQTAIDITKKSKSMMAIRKIKQYEEGFSRAEFVQQALDIYKKLHHLITTGDEEEIGKVVTEKAYPEIIYNLKCKTIRWKFLESIEPPRLVHARVDSIITKDNTFGQLTVRFHTRQTLAIYDRFGRLMFGNELTPKDVLEYVVFEKHLADTYGSWRIHEKIIPEWSGTGHDLEARRTVRSVAAAEEEEKPPPPTPAATESSTTTKPAVVLPSSDSASAQAPVAAAAAP